MDLFLRSQGLECTGEKLGALILAKVWKELCHANRPKGAAPISFERKKKEELFFHDVL
jgi:hypothetical protein